MTPWNERPREVRYLLNPAFCSAILASCAMGYEVRAKAPMPLALAFLCLPIILHGDTRRSLPRSGNASLNNWLLEHREATIGFGKRASSLLPYSREALMFGCSRGILEVVHEGLKSNVEKPASIYKQSQELESCAKAARYLGMWLADSGTPSTIYALWGVAP